MAARRFGRLDADIESIVRSQDLVYENAGTCWQDGHILGNGDMGAIAYAPHWLEWTVNKVDVFDGRDAPKKRLTYKQVMAEVKKRKAKDLKFLPDIEKPDTSKAPLEPLLKSCGQVKVRPLRNEYQYGAAPPYKVRQTLSLWDAAVRMDMRLHKSWCEVMLRYVEPSVPTVSSFVCRGRNLLVIRMRGSSGAMLRKRLELCRPADADFAPPRFGSDRSSAWFAQKVPDGSSYAMAIAAVPLQNSYCKEAGVKAAIDGIEQKGDRIWIEVTGDCDLFVSVATSYEDRNPLGRARKLVNEAMRTGGDRLQKEHARWWADFWKKSFIQMDAEPMLEQLWYFGLYEAGSSFSRAPIPGLCGLWYGFEDNPIQHFFWAVYTLDQNIQIHTLPVFCVNHPELAIPFLDTFLNALPITKRQTREWFELPGACYGLETKFMGGEPSFGSDYRMSLCGGPYCGIVFVWAYRYTRDDRLLKERIYPFLRELIRFWAAFMKKDEDGRYHIPPTVPAEIFTLSRDAITPLSLLKPCLQLAIETSRRFDLDRRERGRWEDLLEHYPPYPTKKGVIMDGADIPWGHPSHETYRLYPLVLAEEPNRETWRLVRNTFNQLKRHPAGWPWFFCARARLMLGRTRGILPYIHGELYHQLKPNGLTVHSGMGGRQTDNPRFRKGHTATPENNSTIMMILTEMLMQSYSGVIRLFPGMVGRANARFGDLRAEGAFLVSSEMSRGKVRFVSVKAEKGGTAQVRNPWRGKVVTVIRSRGGRESIKGALLSLPLKRGESVTLIPKGGRAPVKRVAATSKACPKRKVFKDGTVVRLGKEQ